MVSNILIMATKEYIVALRPGIDYNQFWNEIESITNNVPHIPDRAVAIADELTALKSICHYFLTDAEAAQLKNDPRVLGVEIPAEHRNDIKIKPYTIEVANFTKPGSYGNGVPISSGTNVNWGLIRNSNITNVYGTLSTTTLNYNYVADGSNVDVVIIDSGIQPDHPEFSNASGTSSRLVKYLWDGTVNASTFYQDYNGHGTHVTGIVSGKLFGWAKNANIYSVKFLADSTDTDQGFSSRTFGNVANLVMYWNSQKSVNSQTGYKNPTVVNMSFGYISNFDPSFTTVSNVHWRGNTYTNTTWSNVSYGMNFGEGTVPVRVSAYDAYVDEMVAANIVVCKAAGNDGLKVDSSSGVDYNNYLWAYFTYANVTYSSQLYYMQGASPMSANAIVVGALDVTPFNATTDNKVYFSNAGPGVDIFAAGKNIVSATSANPNGLVVDGYIPGVYSGSPYYKQMSVSGTSQATPQIAGISSLFLQFNPTATPAQVKTWLLNYATTTMTSNIANVTHADYGNTSSQWGGNAGVAYSQIQGISKIKNASGQWTSIANVSVKTGSSTWSTVKNIWTKTSNGTWIQTY